MAIKISSTPRYNETQMLAQIKKTALAYSKIAQTTLMFIYRDTKGGPCYVSEVFYGERNFMHLVGIKSNTLSAVDFYKTCLGKGSRPLEKSDCTPSRDMTTLYKKISVSDTLFDFKHCKCYKIGSKDLITRDNEFEIAIGNNAGVIGYDHRINVKGSKKVNANSQCVPTTLLNRSINEFCSKPSKILFVLQKKENESKYTSIYFEIKKGLFKELYPAFSKEIKDLIDISVDSYSF